MYHGKSWEDKYGAFFDPETVAELKRTESLRFLTDKGIKFSISITVIYGIKI